MKPFINKILILLCLQALPTVLYADETGYEVELIIFEDVHGRYIRSEDWSYNDMLNNTKDIQPKHVKADPQYKQLDWQGAKLASNLDRLKNNSNYRILTNKRWKQTGLDREHAFNIPIDTSTLVTAVDTQTSDTSDITQLHEPYIKGSVKLIMSRYLHFNVNLQYNRPQSIQNNDITEIENMVLPIVNERRMRSREVHYIDHPLVGVVVLATPYKIKSKTIDNSNNEYKTM